MAASATHSLLFFFHPLPFFSSFLSFLSSPLLFPLCVCPCVFAQDWPIGRLVAAQLMATSIDVKVMVIMTIDSACRSLIKIATAVVLLKPARVNKGD